MTLLRPIPVVLLLALLAVGVRADNGGPSGGPNPGNKDQREKRNPRSNNGTYNILITGHFKGQGTATVTPTSVTIVAQVQADGGPMLNFRTDALTITGQYFSGSGTVGGVKIPSIKGRLDAAKSSRLVATFRTSDNHRGRIVGTLPGDASNPNWDDHGGGKDK